MATVEEVLEKLRSKARADQLAGMARYGIAIENRFGVSVPEMRKIAKEVGRDHKLALALWQTGIAEGRMVASMVGEPAKVTGAQMEDWVKGFNSWDICDEVCTNLFGRSLLAWQKILEWAEREEEFVKRAAYVLIAGLAYYDKTSPDERFTALFPIIMRGATDERNYVKKAVNWALRNIGKKNLSLNRAAIDLARQIRQLDSRAARWVAADALRELESEAVQARLKRKAKR